MHGHRAHYSMTMPDIRYSRIGQLAELPVISEIMKIALENKQILSLAAGFTDTEALPVQAVRDVAVSLVTNGQSPEYLQYGTTSGRTELRKFVANRLSRVDHHQSPAYHPDNVMITNGSQQSLYMAVQVLCDPGDIVLVESPSYFVFLELLKGLGITPVGLPLDENDEIDTKATSALLETFKTDGSINRVKAVYLESWYSNPSTRCLTNEKKAEIANVMKESDLIIPILEDGAYFELYFEERFPSTSILAMEEFESFPRLFFGTFTKPFASGLKVGYVICDHPEILAKMASVKGHHDFGTSNFNQAIVEQVTLDGAYDLHLTKARTRYLEKMETLHRSLINEGLPEMGWNWPKPEGGMFLWLKGPEDADTSREGQLFENAVKEGVLFVPGDLCFAPGGPKNNIRLSFGVLEHHDLAQAGHRLACVMRNFK
jgi:2-aminoadipate transaminase